MDCYEIAHVHRETDFDAAVTAIRGDGYTVNVLPEHHIETDAPPAVVKKIVMGINWILYVRLVEAAPDTHVEEQVKES